MGAEIQARGITHYFEAKKGRSDKDAASSFLALAEVNLTVAAGELLTLVGASGSGKSTLLDILGGVTAATEGSIHVDGKLVSGPGLDRAIVFQQYALLPWRTALDNVQLGLEARGGFSAAERRDVARHYLALVGLESFERNFPHELSGGMKQRVAIARSLAYEPDVLLMDEPFSALDAQTRESLQEQLLQIWQRTRKTILFVTHGIDEAIYLGQRIAVMAANPGRIKAIVENPRAGASPSRRGDEVRASPEFGRMRRQISALLRESPSLVTGRSVVGAVPREDLDEARAFG